MEWFYLASDWLPVCSYSVKYLYRTQSGPSNMDKFPSTNQQKIHSSSRFLSSLRIVRRISEKLAMIDIQIVVHGNAASELHSYHHLYMHCKLMLCKIFLRIEILSWADIERQRTPWEEFPTVRNSY